MPPCLWPGGVGACPRRKPKGQCGRLEAVYQLPATSPAGGHLTWGALDAMESTATPPYSAIADALDKFHTSSEPIQALWIVALTATVLGVTWIVMRGVREIVAVLSWRVREAGASMHDQDAQGLWPV